MTPSIMVTTPFPAVMPEPIVAAEGISADGCLLVFGSVPDPGKLQL